MKWPPRTSVNVYASSAVHSAFTVGLLRANMMGRSLMEPMALITSGEKRRPAPATPGAINQRLQREQEQTKPKAKSWKEIVERFGSPMIAEGRSTFTASTNVFGICSGAGWVNGSWLESTFCSRPCRETWILAVRTRKGE